MPEKPSYRDRYPCAACGTGYLDCSGHALRGMKCCVNCDRHPDRWAAGSGAYTVEETEDMWMRAGREMPPDVRAGVDGDSPMTAVPESAEAWFGERSACGCRALHEMGSGIGRDAADVFSDVAPVVVEQDGLFG